MPKIPTIVPPGAAGKSAQFKTRVNARPVSGRNRRAQSVTIIATMYAKLIMATLDRDHAGRCVSKTPPADAPAKNSNTPELNAATTANTASTTE